MCLPAPASAREPTVLAPVKPWNLHYADNSCQLFRQFGNATNPTTFVLERMAPDSPFTMMVFGGALSAKPDGRKAAAVFLPESGPSFDEGEVTETTKGRQTAIHWSRVGLVEEPLEDAAIPDRRRDFAKEAALQQREMEVAAKVTSLQVKEPNKRVTVLKTGSLAKVTQMLRACNREQMAQWGLDPAVQDKIVLNAMSKRSLASLFTYNDYPALALQAGQMSIVTARLIVGADGTVSRCTSLTPFVGEGFKETVCARLSKATFEPAEMADGTKVPTFVTARIRFVLPD
jgi:hypothetical protein